MAFVWMDLLDHGHPGLANGLLSDWLDASGDTTAPEVRADQPEPTPDPDSAPATPLGGLTPAHRRLRHKKS
jgi:hypothetical protein